jgi:hypothetical protein
MRILFDQGTPVQIRRSLEAHTVKTSREQGWSTLANGELLRVAEEAGFDVLLTTDKNMRYQQNFEGRRITVVVLGNGLWPFVKPMLPQVVTAVETAIAGTLVMVDIPNLSPADAVTEFSHSLSGTNTLTPGIPCPWRIVISRNHRACNIVTS